MTMLIDTSIIGLIAMEFRDIHGSHVMSLSDFDAPLTFPLAPPRGWYLWF